MVKNENAQSRLEKVLAGMLAGVLITSIVSILVIVGFAAANQSKLIPIVLVFPYVGLPAAAVLLLALVITRIVKSKRN